MVKVGLLVRLEAAPGREAELERLLTGLLTRVQREAGVRVWLAVRFGPASFGVVTALTDATARNAHLAGDVVSRLKDSAGDLLAEPLRFENMELLAAKLPR